MDEKVSDEKNTKMKRVWLYRFIAIVIVPVLFLGLFELGLRVAGYGYPTSAVVGFDWNEQESWCENYRFTWRFFPRQIAREPEPFIFLAEKPGNTYRIFVMGESAAQGVPDAAFSFSRILEVMLGQAYPGVKFEVINVAITAVNSHVIYQLADELSDYEPDMFILYMGNNEVVGPFGVGTIFGSSSLGIGMIRLGLFIKTTRLGQLFSDLVSNPGSGPGEWRGLEMFLDKQVRWDDPGLAKVYLHFKRNLEDIIGIARKKNIQVVVSTVGCNLKDNPPFASLHRKDLGEGERKEWEGLYQQGVVYETAGSYREALLYYGRAVKIDSEYAALPFRMGKCYWQLGEYEKARESFLQAREYDTLRFRVDQRLNDIIREVSCQDWGKNKGVKGVVWVDAEKAFALNSLRGIPGEEIFYEHVHLNFTGNYILAGVIFREIRRVLPDWVTKKSGGGLGGIEHQGGRVISIERCRELLGYTGWDQFNLAYDMLYNYIMKPPHTNQLYHDEQVQRLERDLQGFSIFLGPVELGLAMEQYRLAIKEAPDDWRLHEKFAQLLFKDMKEYSLAADEYRKVIEYLPHSYRGYAGLGFVLRLQGDLEKAIYYQLKALEINPYKADVHNNLAFTFQLSGQKEKAKAHYEEAIKVQSHFIPAYRNLALLLGEEKRFVEAVAVCNKGLEREPASWGLYHTLGILFDKQGKKVEAVEALRKALQIDPEAGQTVQLLNRILQE